MLAFAEAAADTTPVGVKADLIGRDVAYVGERLSDAMVLGLGDRAAVAEMIEARVADMRPLRVAVIGDEYDGGGGHAHQRGIGGLLLDDRLVGCQQVRLERFRRNLGRRLEALQDGIDGDLRRGGSAAVSAEPVAQHPASGPRKREEIAMILVLGAAARGAEHVGFPTRPHRPSSSRRTSNMLSGVPR